MENNFKQFMEKEKVEQEREIEKEKQMIFLGLEISYSMGGIEDIIDLLKNYITKGNSDSFVTFACLIKEFLIKHNVSEEDKIKFNAVVKVGVEKLMKHLEKNVLFDCVNEEE